MLRFYREKQTGDFLAIDGEVWNEHTRCFEGRGAAIAGAVSSLCWVSVSPRYLGSQCEEVSASELPEEWQAAVSGRAEIRHGN